MTVAAAVIETKAGSAVAPAVAKKVLSLVSKAKYESPKVVSFVIDDLKAHSALALAGNI